MLKDVASERIFFVNCLRNFLFRDQLKLRKKDSTLIAEISVSTETLLNDIKLLRNLVEFQKINAIIAITKCLNHLWYLNQECAAMAIFDDRVEHDEKMRMAQKGANDNEEENIDLKIIGKKLPLLMRKVSNFVKKDLPTDLLSNHFLQLFKRFGICFEFLHDDPLHWNTREDYLTGKNINSALNLQIILRKRK